MAAKMAAKEYVCSLNEASLRKAQVELNENPQDRMGAVQSLRDWVEAQPHLKFPTDTVTLLQYLRCARFSQIGARDLIEDNLRMRKEFPKWFYNIDTKEKGITSLAKLGFTIPLPKKNPEGRTIILFKPGALGPKDKLHGFETERRFGLALQLWVCRDESTQVNGQVHLLDMSAFTSKHVSRMTNDAGMKSHKVWQDCVPVRLISSNFFNTGSYFDPMLTFMRPFTKKDFMDKVVNHHSLETIYKIVPMECLPEDYLPDEYTGPNAGPLNKLIDDFAKQMVSPEFNAYVAAMTSDKYFIDDSKKPAAAPLQHFRKLNVD